MRKPLVRRGLLALAGVLLAAGLLVPFLDADRFRQGIQDALEQTLGRKVEIQGEVRFALLGRPGFTLTSVVIHDDPASSAEPFVYATELGAALRPLSLLGGRFQFSSLRLVDASVNLGKPDGSGWNAHALLRRALERSAATGGRLPDIQIAGGRLNLRSGSTKSNFYLVNVDLELAQDSGNPERLAVRFSGEAARTDLSARGYGSFSGRGSLRVPKSEEMTMNLRLTLDRVALSDASLLVLGRSMGLEGFVASRATIKGTPSSLEVEGKLQMEELERWGWLFSGLTSWALDYRGRLSLGEELVELETSPAPEGSLRLAVRIRAADILLQPRWAILASAHELSLQSALLLGREVGFHTLAFETAEGRLSGAFSYSPRSGLRGQFMLANGSVAVPEAGRIALGPARLVLDSKAVRFTALLHQAESEETAELEASVQPATQRAELRVQTAGLSVPHFQLAWKAISGGAVPGFLGGVRNGNWSGVIRSSSEPSAAQTWSAEITVRDSALEVAGFASPLEIQSAAVSASSSRLEIKALRARMGGARVDAVYRQGLRERGLDQVRLRLASLELSRLEALLAPTLRRDEGFLSRTLRLKRSSAPEWLRGRRANLAISIPEIRVGDFRVENLRAQGQWQGAGVQLSQLQAGIRDGLIEGRLAVDLGGAEPVYRGEFRVRHLGLMRGELDAEGQFEAAGTGARLLRSIRMEGAFESRAIQTGAGYPWQVLSGGVRAGRAGAALRFQLSEVKAMADGIEYTGQGTVFGDGRMQLELGNGGEPIRISGRVSGPELDFMPAP